MDNLNLGSDESILKKNSKIISSGIRYEAVLTNRRIILAEREIGTVREDIPYNQITLAVAGLNSIREPTLRLVITPPSGEQRSIELIFVYQPGGLNLQDLEASITVLKERKVTVQGSAHLDATSLMSRVHAVSSSLPAGDEPDVRPAVPEMGIMGSSRPAKQQLPEETRIRPYLIVIAAIVVIVAVIFAGSFIAGLGNKGSPTGQQSAPLPGKTTPIPTTVLPVTTEIPVEVSAPATPPTGVSNPLPETVPANGTWVRISYPGNYTGNLKSGGWNVDVNSTGTSDYILPVRDSLIEGSIAKSEGTGGTMGVGVYYYGTLISEQQTSKPFGEISLSLDIQKALAATPTPTPTRVPAPVSFSGDLTVPSVAVPESGVWARVFYPGNYVGSFSANGRTREVNNTGDQFFQLSMSSGSIDGVMEKQDDTARNMAIQIYKDGALVASQNTTAPHGDIDLHITI